MNLIAQCIRAPNDQVVDANPFSCATNCLTVVILQ
jgi:hypothetical protein